MIQVMTQTMPLSEVKARFSEVVEQVATTHARVTVTRNGRPTAVVLSAEDLEVLEETIEILSDPDVLQRLRDAEAAIAEGDYATEADFRQMLGELRLREG